MLHKKNVRTRTLHDQKKKRQVLYKKCNFSFREQKEYKGGPVDLSLNFF
jgi:hypothetical protein